MNKVVQIYKNSALIRFDKDPAIPYYEVKDFVDLNVEENSFKNSAGEEIKYFFYYFKCIFTC